MSTQGRKAVSPTMAQVIARIVEITSKCQDRTVIREAMDAILAVSRTAQAEEEAPLAAVIPVVVDKMKKYPDMVEAMTTVPVLMYEFSRKSISPLSHMVSSTKLGPRIIAYLSPIVETCISVFSAARAGPYPHPSYAFHRMLDIRQTRPNLRPTLFSGS